METITSKENPLIKQMLKLVTSRKERSLTGLFVIEGIKLCVDALNSDIKIRNFLITPDCLEKNRGEVAAFQEKSERAFWITDQIATKLSDTVSPQGIFCVCEMPLGLDIVNSCNKIGSNRSFLVLESIQDPGNMGTIIRTAEALGMGGVLMTEDCADPYSPKVLRSTMGSVFRMPLQRFESITLIADALSRQHIPLYGAVLSENAKALTKIKLNIPCACLIGNEGNGLSEQAVGLCDHLVMIDMHGGAESLNAAIAAGIFMWEISRRTE